MTKGILYFVIVLTAINGACRSGMGITKTDRDKLPEQFVLVLGIAQDAGYPQLGCDKECCTAYWKGKEKKKHIVSLALFDTQTGQYFLFEATPDITAQIQMVQPYLAQGTRYIPDGIFLTHAHIGHYTGLMQLGREAMGARNADVWAMPKMKAYLENNGPWSQLVSLKNIHLRNLQADSTIKLTAALSVTPFKVPHRDEYSETVGFIIQSEKKRLLFIPDIDKWEKWDRSILNEIRKADQVLIDGTFYNGTELPGRDIREVPHPFVSESMALFDELNTTERSKIMFIHFNHTNPLLRHQSAEKTKVKAAGYKVAEEGMVIGL